MNRTVEIVDPENVPLLTLSKGTTVKRLITKKMQSSDKLQLGIAALKPKGDPHDFYYPDKDEAYYVIKGRLILSWNGKQTEVKAGQAVFLPSGIKYRELNTGDEEAIFVYALSPPIE